MKSELGVAVLVVIACCGGDVDLGGASGAPCQPCTTNSACIGACVAIGGDDYCATPCPNGTECAPNEQCASVSGTRACVPSSGKCPTPPPPSVDGAVVDHCGPLVGPNVAAACHACSKSSPSCQPNGCYGGYWCNTSIDDCSAPPKVCF